MKQRRCQFRFIDFKFKSLNLLALLIKVNHATILDIFVKPVLFRPLH